MHANVDGTHGSAPETSLTHVDTDGFFATPVVVRRATPEASVSPVKDSVIDPETSTVTVAPATGCPWSSTTTAVTTTRWLPRLADSVVVVSDSTEIEVGAGTVVKVNGVLLVLPTLLIETTVHS